MNSIFTGDSLILTRQVTIKVIVTTRWKEEVTQQLQAQVKQLDSQIEQIDAQKKDAIAQLEKQKNEGNAAKITKQVESINAQVNQKKGELLQKKNQFLQQLQQVQLLELEQQVTQGQMESLFEVKKGDNIVKKMQIEILMRDGVVEDIKGEL